MLGLGFDIRSKQQEQSAPTVPAWMQLSGAGDVFGDDLANPAIYETQASRFTRSWLCYACVTLISQYGSSISIEVKKEGEDDPIADHPFVHLLNHPNPFTSRFELIESTLASLELTGNAYWFLHQDEKTNIPTQIWVMRPDRTQPIPDKKMYIKGFKYTVNSQEITFSPEEVVHFKRYHPLKDYEGLSPIEAGNYAMSTDVAAEMSAQSFYSNSMRVSAILTSEREEVDPRQRKLMEQYFRETYTEPKNAYKPLFLWGGWNYSQLSMTPRDAEYVEGRNLNRKAIFAIYGVHPGLLFAEDVNRANALTAERMFARLTMSPKLERIAQRINLELMPFYGDESFVKFVNIIPQDRELELKYHTTYGANMPVLTINEIRKDLGRDPLSGGDVTVPEFLTQNQPPMPVPGLSLPPRSKVYALIGNGHEQKEQMPYLVLPGEEVEAGRPESFRNYP